VLTLGLFVGVHLKKLPFEFFARVDDAQEPIRYYRADLGRASALLLPRLPFTSDIEVGLQLEDLDMETACASVPLRSAMAEVLDSRRDLLADVRRLSLQLEAVRAALPRNP
jgi:hypothetical protein